MAGFELTHLLNLRAAGAAEVRQAVAATFFREATKLVPNLCAVLAGIVGNEAATTVGNQIEADVSAARTLLATSRRLGGAHMEHLHLLPIGTARAAAHMEADAAVAEAVKEAVGPRILLRGRHLKETSTGSGGTDTVHSKW